MYKSLKQVIKKMKSIQPQRPVQIPDHVEACISALVDGQMGDKISLGGGFGLLHYFDYRTTHDVDAWWVASATTEVREQVIAILEKTLKQFGQVKTRSWGDVVSAELKQQGRTVFSFQIAGRSVQLEPSRPAPWKNILLDSFVDVVASKMVALVERGAPRDFRDVYGLCQAGLLTTDDCWSLWRKRQHLAGDEVDQNRARLAVETHLARIEQHRPLHQIKDTDQQADARRVRTWYKQEFLHGLE